MAGGINLASKYSKKVDEKFHRESQVAMALNNDYEFTGVQTVNVYSLPVVPLNDYSRSGSSRYGTVTDLTRNVQGLTVARDRAFTFVIDKGDKIQSQMVSEAGKALSREIRLVCVPEYDAYCFGKLADAAEAAGGYSATVISADNAYALFLAGQEYLGDRNVPDKGRVAFCTYKFANYLKQDSAFMKYSNMSQEMLLKGVIGEVDGTKIVKVPTSRLPAGAAFLITHPSAATGPKQLEEYKTHENPPGYSGWLVEGRLIYDCFVMNEKADAIYYHGGQSVLKHMNISTASTDTNKSTIILVSPSTKAESTNKWYYDTAETQGELTTVTFGTEITTSAWTELTSNSTEITPTAGHTYVRVVEVDSDDEPVGYGDAVLNIG